MDMNILKSTTVTYDHRLERIGHPVRSAIHKLQIGRLVVGWVTTSEYLLLYVFVFFFLNFFFPFCSHLILLPVIVGFRINYSEVVGGSGLSKTVKRFETDRHSS